MSLIERNIKPFCVDCGKYSSDNLYVLPCSYCQNTSCMFCLGISESLGQMLITEKVLSVTLTCKSCRNAPTLRDIFTYIKNINTKILNIEEAIKECVTETVKREVNIQVESKIRKEIDPVIDQLKKHSDIIGTIEKSLSAQVADAVIDKQDCTDCLKKEDFKEQVQIMIKEAKEEDRDRDRRKTNLLFFNVPESKGLDKLEEMNADLNLVKRVTAEISKDSTENINIRYIKRLKNNDGNSQNSRPLLVALSDVDTKFKILRKAKTLLGSTDQVLRTIRISHDRTLMERKEYKLLKKVLVKKNDPTLAIRRGRIVKMPKEEITASFRREDNQLDGLGSTVGIRDVILSGTHVAVPCHPSYETECDMDISALQEQFKAVPASFADRRVDPIYRYSCIRL